MRNRILKFRGLNKNGTWEYTGNTLFMDDFWRLVATGEITNVCQFTGLTDADGTGIFDGDSLKVTALLGVESCVVKVEWDNELARFVAGNSPLSAYARQSKIINESPDLSTSK